MAGARGRPLPGRHPPTWARGLSGSWSLHLREERLESNCVRLPVIFLGALVSGERGAWMGRDRAGGRMWRWRVEKQGMTCEALKIWAGGRHDEKDGRKGGHSHSCPLTAPGWTAHLNATGNKAIFSTVPSKSQALSKHLQSGTQSAEAAWLGGDPCGSRESPRTFSSPCPTSLR